MPAIDKGTKEAGPFYLIRFAARANKNEKTSVSFTVNGREKTFRRQWVLPISESYLEAAKHAVTPIWSDEIRDGQNRKVSAGNALSYPFEIIYANIPEDSYNTFCRKMSTSGCEQLSDQEIKSIIKAGESTSKNTKKPINNHDERAALTAGDILSCQDMPRQ